MKEGEGQPRDLGHLVVLEVLDVTDDRSVHQPLDDEPHVVPALVAPTLLFVACGALLAVAAAADGGGPGLVGQLAWAALALAPGLWLTVGVGTALVGWAPRLTPLLWALLGWSLFATWVGDLLDLPRVLLDATPFAALPRLIVPSSPFKTKPHRGCGWSIHGSVNVPQRVWNVDSPPA